MKPLLTLAAELANRKTTSQALVEDALTRIWGKRIAVVAERHSLGFR